MVALTLSSVIVALVSSVFLTQNNFYRFVIQRTRVQDNLRVVTDLIGSSPELCVKVRGSSSMLLLGCLGDLLRFEKREIQVATFAPDRSSP